MTRATVGAGGLGRLVETLRAAGCVFAEDEARLLLEAAGAGANLSEMVARRVSGVPLEHVLGWAEFCGLRIAVEPGVFVPRRRSELVVREALAVLAAAPGSGALVVDLCCGSGALGVAVAAGAVGETQLVAVDLDPVATACASGNLAPYGGRAFVGDLDAALPVEIRGRVDLVVANAPYVPLDEIGLMPREARDHEPRTALDGGPDGVDVQRQVVAAAGRLLSPDGHLLIETSERQAALTAEAMTVCALTPRVVRCADLAATVVVGVRALPGSPGG